MEDENGKPITNHTVGEVWCYIISSKVEKLRDVEDLIVLLQLY